MSAGSVFGNSEALVRMPLILFKEDITLKPFSEIVKSIQ